MRTIKRIMAGAAACALLMMGALPVRAEDAVRFRLVPDPIEKGEDYLTMTYDLRGGASFTSGKVTITYDTEYLEYSDHDLGAVLAKTMSNVKDPYQEQGKEGEIVIAFSAEESVKANDTFLDLYFDLKKSAKDGQQYQVNLRVDELYNGSTKVDSVVEEAPITVGAEVDEEAFEEEPQEDTETEPQTEPQTQAQTQPQTQAQTQKQTQATNPSTQAQKETAKASNAKTGDATQAVPYAVGGALAVFILGGLALAGKKKQ